MSIRSPLLITKVRPAEFTSNKELKPYFDNLESYLRQLSFKVGTDETDVKGLVIGTDVQAFNDGLQSIAGLTEGTDQMLYTTGEDSYALTTLTEFARTLLDDGSATEMKVTLGIGTSVDTAAVAARVSLRA